MTVEDIFRVTDNEQLVNIFDKDDMSITGGLIQLGEISLTIMQLSVKELNTKMGKFYSWLEITVDA